jgi:predicted glycosyltransferase
LGDYEENWLHIKNLYLNGPASDDRKAIFVGEPEDIPDDKFGFLLPNRRDYAQQNYSFIGYIIRFDPENYRDKMQVRKNLGYGTEPLIICSIGGTSIGKNLLELCNRTYPIIKKRIPTLKMVLVTGPRLSPDTIKAHPGVEIKGFVPELFKHYAASDLAIVQGGFSSTLELTSLRRPFIFFPIEGHSEQNFVAERLAKYNAGIRMYFSKTTPESLAEQVIDNIEKPVNFKSIRTDGAQWAARSILQFL